MAIELYQELNQDTVMSVQDYRALTKNRTEQELADDFGVAQSTVHRWLQRDDVFVEVQDGRWKTIFVERVLKHRKIRRKRKRA